VLFQEIYEVLPFLLGTATKDETCLLFHVPPKELIMIVIINIHN